MIMKDLTSLRIEAREAREIANELAGTEIAALMARLANTLDIMDGQVRGSDREGEPGADRPLSAGERLPIIARRSA
jgi:hypothetical protein